MAPLSPERRNERLKATRAVAAALLDDISHLKATVSTIPDQSTMRRISPLLRRIIVDCELSMVAAPREPELNILTVDNSPFYQALPPFRIFLSGNLGFGFRLRAVKLEPTSTIQCSNELIGLKLESFAKQKLIYFDGKWITRSDIIKYVANYCSGIHSGVPDNAESRILSRVRRFIRLSVVNGIPEAVFDPDGPYIINDEFNFSDKRIDPVMNEIYLTAYFITISPDISKLCDYIRKELSTL